MKINVNEVADHLNHSKTALETLKNNRRVDDDANHPLNIALHIIDWEDNTEDAIPHDARLIKMARWFSSRNDIPDHQLLSLASYDLFFQRLFTDTVEPVYLLPLSKALIVDWQLYAGFLLWALKANVSHNDIIDSNILHHFFSYYLIEPELLHKMYAFLSHDKIAKKFIGRLKRKPCHQRGFMNTPEGNQYVSYSLLGRQFKHRKVIDELGIQDYISVLPDTLSSEMIEKSVEIFTLFEGRLLELLDFDQPDHARVLINILSSAENAEKFFTIFTQQIMEDALSLPKMQSIITLIKQYFWRNTVSRKRKYELLEAYPMLIYAAPLRYFVQEIPRVLRTLSDEKHQSLRHWYLLCELGLNKFVISRLEDSDKWLLFHTIFSHLCKHPVGMDGDIYLKLKALHHELSPFYEEHLKTVSTELKTMIQSFIEGNETIMECESFWDKESTLTDILSGLSPEEAALSYQQQYYIPVSRTDFFAEILKAIASMSDQHTQVLRLQDFKEYFSSDSMLWVETLQEILLTTRDINILFLYRYFFEDQLNLSRFLCSPYNIVIFTFPGLTVQCPFPFLSMLLTQCNPAQFSSMINYIRDYDVDHSLRKELLKWLKNHVTVNLYQLADSQKFDLVTGVTDYPPLNNFIKIIFNTAVQQNKISFLRHLLTLTPSQLNENSIRKYFIESGFVTTSTLSHEVILLLTGLHSDPCNSSIIPKDNIHLFFKFVLTLTDSRIRWYLKADYKDNNNILHLAAKNPSLKTLKIIMRSLEDHCAPSEIHEMLIAKNRFNEMPASLANRPIDRQINRYLENKKAEFSALINSTDASPRFFRNKRNRTESSTGNRPAPGNG